MKPNAVKIKTGTFEGNPVQDVVFALIRDYHPYAKGGGFYLVDGKTASEGEYPSKPIRVKVSDPSMAELGNAEVVVRETKSNKNMCLIFKSILIC